MAFLRRFHLQNWRIIIPEVYRQIVQIMILNNSTKKAQISALLILNVSSGADTWYRDSFPWRLAEGTASSNNGWDNVVSSWRDQCQVRRTALSRIPLLIAHL